MSGVEPIGSRHGPDPQRSAATGDSQVRGELLAELMARADELLEPAVTQMTTTGGYALLSPAQVEAVRGTVRATFGSLVTCALDDRGLTFDEDAFFEGIGAQRATMGVPREDATEAFETVYDRCYDRLVELAVARGEPEAGEVLSRLSSRLRRLAVAARTAIERGHDAQTGRELCRVAGDRSAFLETVLAGGADDEQLAARAKELGLATHGLWALLVALLPDGAGDPAGRDARLAAGGDRLASALDGALHTGLRYEPWPHVVVLGAHTSSEQLVARLDRVAADQGLVVVSATRPRPASLGPVYQRVRPHVPAMRRLVAAGGVTGLAALRVYEPLVSCGPDRADLIIGEALRGVLGDPEKRSRDWVETLDAYVEFGGDVAAMAVRLDLSRRAVYHRLDAIRAASGLDFTRDHTILHVGQAVLLYRMHRDRLPEPNDPVWCDRD